MGGLHKGSHRLLVTAKGGLQQPLRLLQGIGNDYIYDAVIDLANEISFAVKATLERTPPEIYKDIAERGIYLTGGSSRIKGLKDMIAKETGIKVKVNNNPEDSVVNGLGRIIEEASLKRLAFKNIKSEYE